MSNQEPKFYECDSCKIIVEKICGNRDTFECCDIPMKEMAANSTEGATEKHLPVVEKNGNHITVKVGSVFHPMTSEHSIEWVYLQTKNGAQRINLKPDQEPVAEFILSDTDEAVAAYAYCNLHGFWKTDIE